MRLLIGVFTLTFSYFAFAQDSAEVVKALKQVTSSLESVKNLGSAGPLCPVSSATVPQESLSVPIDQSQATPKNYCTGSENASEYERYSNPVSENDEGVAFNLQYRRHKATQEKIVEGFNIDMPSAEKSFPVEEGEVFQDLGSISPKKSYYWEFLGRGKEMEFSIVDSPVREEFDPKTKKIKERFSSTNIRLNLYYFFPRKVIPSIVNSDSQYTVTMTTGEQVVFDKLTGKIISGVATEVDSKTKLVKRPTYTEKFSDKSFKYQGEGIFLDVQITNDLDPRRAGNTILAKAYVNGVEQVCSLRSDDLFTRDYGYNLKPEQEGYYNSCWNCTRLKFEKDEELYQLIKKKCPTFKFPKLISAN